MNSSLTMPAETQQISGLNTEESQHIHSLHTTGKHPVRNIVMLMIYLVTLFYIIIGALS